ncbi:MAG: nucleotidyltransferase family protein [Bacteroidales bacterium]|nr:nucleotidyltransferase family protein [Bacteroidales bacterium]
MAKRYIPSPQTVETYFNIVRNALWGTPLGEIPSLYDVLKLAEVQRTRGLVYQSLLDCKFPIEEKVFSVFDDFLLRTAYTHGIQDQVMVKAVTALRSAGIEPVLLKGEGNSRNYPNNLLRECGDIDLYVGEKNYEAACRAMRELASSKDVEDSSSTDKHYHIKVGAITVEIHRFTHIFDVASLNPIYQKYSAEGTSTGLVPIDVEKIKVNTPEPTFNAFFVFIHAWHHFLSEGLGMRHMCDWVTLLHNRRDLIDKKKLSDMVLSLGMEIPWKVFAYIAVEKLGLPKEDVPLYDPSVADKAEATLSIILEEGNFGTERKKGKKRSANYYIGKAQSLLSYIRRDARIAKIFPGETGHHFFFVLVRGFRQVWLDKTEGND